jgi:hypothetical protein
MWPINPNDPSPKSPSTNSSLNLDAFAATGLQPGLAVWDAVHPLHHDTISARLLVSMMIMMLMSASLRLFLSLSHLTAATPADDRLISFHPPSFM